MLKTWVMSWLGKTAKSIFIFLFFSFLLLLSWTYYTEGSTEKCHIVTVTWQEVTLSHHMMSYNRSHDRHGKVVHRPCSNCISSIENLTRTLLSSLCQSLNKEQLALFQLGVYWLYSSLEFSFLTSELSSLHLYHCRKLHRLGFDKEWEMCHW